MRPHHHDGIRDDWPFIVGIGLNATFVVAEAAFGVFAHSMALVADAGHNLGDVLGLALALGASRLARRRPSKRRTYGFRRATILAALANAVFLVVAAGALAWESVRRLGGPGPVGGKTVMVVAAVGVVVNGVSALAFREGTKDLNRRGAFLHLLADAAVSLMVVATGALVSATGLAILDPLAGILLAIAIVVTAWRLLLDSANLALDAVPAGIDVDEVRAFLEGLPRVREVHDLHIWAMSTTESALTAHFVMDTTSCEPCFLDDVGDVLHRRFGIEHSTLQVEATDVAPRCGRATGSRV